MPNSAQDEIAGLRSQLEMRSRDLELAVAELDAVRGSLSWKLTAPFRSVRTSLRSLAGTIRQPSNGTAEPSAVPGSMWTPTDPPVPLLERSDVLPRSTARTVAFYLPQFHAIPENDQWWGHGFTEWSNVVRARPLFAGHDQPRLPGELGFYDLRLVDVQRRQVELAKLYGIDAFCFYFYWFSGRRLLERPIEQYLEHTELDLPFCLCWANENWTRRWDGSDSTVLIAHTHSPEDDLAFIEHVSRYLVDPRYLRVDGRPLLLVYRPCDVPDPRATTDRWRRWLREHHGMDLFLAYVQGRTDEDPATFGCDAAVEFPPVRPPGRELPREITLELSAVAADVRAHVYDWRDVAADSESYEPPPYRLFRGVCPSWDNTARRGNSASILWNNSPVGFQNWLLRALQDTEARLPHQEQLVFVNAWNEWAEACYLEPDAQHGYAYLEAARVASVRAATTRPRRIADPTFGVVLHAFHTDLLPELVEPLEALAEPPPVLVTTTVERRPLVEARFRESPLLVEILEFDNVGRDVWPFLAVLPRCAELGWDVVLKVHTKRAGYRDDGHHWRRNILGALLEEDAFERAFEAFRLDEKLGMVGPAGHRLATLPYIGGNSARVATIARRLGIADVEPLDSFFAGTMFYVRLDALAPLRAVQLAARDFEAEAGQADGTLAHALERCFPLSVVAAGFDVRDTSQLRGLEQPPLSSGYPYAVSREEALQGASSASRR